MTGRTLHVPFPAFTRADWSKAVSASGGAAVGGLIGESKVLPRRIGAPTITGHIHKYPQRNVQLIHAIDDQSAIEQLLEAREGDVSAFEILFAGCHHPLGGALSPDAGPAMAEAVAAMAPTQVRINTPDPALARMFVERAGDNAEIVVAFDAIAAVALDGDNDVRLRQANVRANAEALASRGIAGAAAVADGRIWHAGGADEVQELAATLASFVAYLRITDDPVRVGIVAAADSDQFRTIAKLRALRLLLGRVLEVAGVSSAVPPIHAETAWRTMSASDPQTNLLRATSAAFAAVVGGADTITVLPFDALTEVSALGRRLARNSLAVLVEEGGIAAVADPAAGSGAIEDLTDRLAEVAWRRFQAIERGGGIVAAIRQGDLLREISETRKARIAALLAGQATMVGVNAFNAGTGHPGKVPSATSRTETERLVFTRLPEMFEAGS